MMCFAERSSEIKPWHLDQVPTVVLSAKLSAGYDTVAETGHSAEFHPAA